MKHSAATYEKTAREFLEGQMTTSDGTDVGFDPDPTAALVYATFAVAAQLTVIADKLEGIKRQL